MRPATGPFPNDDSKILSFRRPHGAGLASARPQITSHGKLIVSVLQELGADTRARAFVSTLISSSYAGTSVARGQGSRPQETFT